MENTNTTKAKIVLFSVLGLLAVANYPGNPNKNGEVEFASIAKEDSSLALQALRSIELVPGSEERDDKKEKKITEKLVKIFEKLQDDNIRKGKLNRGTHNKGSCFNGKFRVLSDQELKEQVEFKDLKNSDEMIQRLRRGIYSDIENYDAEIRFANAQGLGKFQPDTTGDVRALSFSINLNGKIKDHVGDSRQDFNANSTPMFAVNNIEEFLGVMGVVTIPSGVARFFSDLENMKVPTVSTAGLGTASKNLASVANGIKAILDNSRTDVLSYATEQYWGNVPYTHGIEKDGKASDLVKFKLTPCDGNIERQSSNGKPDDYLQNDIAQRANHGKVCFNFQLQFFNIEKLREFHSNNIIEKSWTQGQWIENGGAEWPESVSKFYTVAKLEIPLGAERQNCGERYINPRLHSTRENMPIGSLARVRAEVELSSMERRMAAEKNK